MVATVGMAMGQIGDVTAKAAAGIVVMESSLKRVDELMDSAAHHRPPERCGWDALSVARMFLAALPSESGERRHQPETSISCGPKCSTGRLPPKVIHNL
jgi:hypothetical protein